MEVFIARSYEEMSEIAADALIESAKSTQNPLICLASGDTPTGLYKELVKRYNHAELDVSKWSFVALDEWLGMNGEDEGSCRYYLNKQVFTPLNIPESNICCFNGKADDPDAECKRVEEFIRRHNGIDAAIVGLGMNGHIGMNEPGTLPELHSHVSIIHPVTQKVGQKYFTGQKELTHGITLGLANMLEAKNVMLLVNGSGKAEIVKRVLEGEITEEIPATILRDHPDFTVYLDKDAAQLLHESW